jgi:hypothetical protein
MRCGQKSNGLFQQNDERTHPYQRGRASITGLGLGLRRIIETQRLVGVAVARLVLLLVYGHYRSGLYRVKNDITAGIDRYA